VSQAVDKGVSSETPSEPRETADRLDPALPVAVFLVGGGLEWGASSLSLFGATYSTEYRQLLFVAVGVMDYAVIDSGVDPGQGFKGTEEARRLQEKTRLRLDPYLAAARQLGMKADCRVSIATDPVDEIARQSDEVIRDFPRSAFFVSKLEFRKRRWLHSLLHGDASNALRKRLEKKGLHVKFLHVIVP
jgi:hypothetical protein